MCAKKSAPPRLSRLKSLPDKPFPPARLPRRFPERAPLSDDGIEAAKKEAASTMKPVSGEDPLVESGLPEDDPERPQETSEEQSNR